MNRALLKQDAKDAMKAANPHPVLTTLVFWAIQLAAQIILGIVSSICGFTTYFAAAISSGMYEDSAFLNYVPSIGAFLIYLVVAIVISLLLGTVQFGYYAYSLKVFKHEEAGISELLAYFPMLLKIFGLSLWMCLFIMLWSCLCYIPGIIAMLRYSQAFYILAEDPNERSSVGILRAAAFLHPLVSAYRCYLRYCKPVCNSLYRDYQRRLLFKLKAGTIL